jgi:hypothetical protein
LYHIDASETEDIHTAVHSYKCILLGKKRIQAPGTSHLFTGKSGKTTNFQKYFILAEYSSAV